MLALFSSSPFSPPTGDLDKSTEALGKHLTNTALQLERGETGVRLFDELVGSHPLGSPITSQTRPIRRPARGRAMGMMMDPDQRAKTSKLEESMTEIFSTADSEDIQNQIADILSDTFKAALGMSVHFQVRTISINGRVSRYLTCAFIRSLFQTPSNYMVSTLWFHTHPTQHWVVNTRFTSLKLTPNQPFKIQARV